MSDIELVQLEGEDRPRGICWCGCGGTTELETKTDSRFSKYKGIPKKVIGRHRSCSPEERIALRVRVDSNGCWIWPNVGSSKYGTTTVGGNRVSTHRYSYEVYIGPIPSGYEVDHLCRVRSCCNPDHLEAVTQEENERRRQEFHGFGSYRTHCRHGHAWTEENTYPRKDGRRHCRVCVREQRRARRAVAA